uniref:hypothetical protein n=1 Tax=Escherichia coli TaxID=562 RepID=UPI00224E6097
RGDPSLTGSRPPGPRELLQQVESGRPPPAASDRLTSQGFPRNLLLPQGRPGGLPVTVVAVVTDSQGRQWEGHAFTDGRDPFFPMDRQFFKWELDTVPNAHVQHLRIFHRSKDELNSTQP